MQSRLVLATDVSEQPIDHIFKGQTVLEELFWTARPLKRLQPATNLRCVTSQKSKDLKMCNITGIRTGTEPTRHNHYMPHSVFSYVAVELISIPNYRMQWIQARHASSTCLSVSFLASKIV